MPEHVRGDIVAGLGSPVVEARSQHGGFSPGAAVRVVCADGTRVFVKACGVELNPDTPVMNRAEIVALEQLAQLGKPVPHARLLSAYDDGSWVALVLEDIDGHRPQVPWTVADATVMSRSLEQLAATKAPRGLPDFADMGQLLTGWDAVAAEPDGIAPTLLERLPDFLACQELARQVTVGDRLVHWDARADNVIVRDGEAVLLDWAWAGRGAPWLDTLLLAMDFRIQGGPDPDTFLAASPVTREVPPDHLASVIACMVGVWHDRARRPAPPGLPTIRTWQAWCGAAALDWLDTGSLWR